MPAIQSLSEGDMEIFIRRIQRYSCFTPMDWAEQDTAFNKDIFLLKNSIEKGAPEYELSDKAQGKKRKYLHIRHYGNKVTATFNEKAIETKKMHHGYAVLVSNCEKDTLECLCKYGFMETVELYFESGNQKVDGTRTRI